MTFNMESIVRSKNDMRYKLVSLPIGEKLTMLDALRERSVTLQNAVPIPNNSSDFSVGGKLES